MQEIRFRYPEPETRRTVEFRKRFALSRKEADGLDTLLQEAARGGYIDRVLDMAKEVQETRVQPTRTPSFAEWAETWYEESVLGFKNKRRKPNSRSCQKYRRSQLENHLLPALGEIQIDKITPAIIEEEVLRRLLRWKAKQHPNQAQAGRYSPTSIDNYRATLSAIFERAKRAKLVSSNPVLEVEWPARQKVEMQFYSIEEADRFLVEAEHYEEGVYWYSLFFFVLRTGICQGELFGLTVDHLDLGGTGRPPKVFIQQQVQHGELCEPKWDRKRAVDLDSAVVKVMKAYLAWRQQRFAAGPWLFPSLKTDGLVTYPSKYVARPMQDIAATAGVKRIKFHELRHSRGTQLAQANIGERTIAEQLGHTDVRTSRRYTHMAPGVGAEAAERVARLSKAPVPADIVDLASYKAGKPIITRRLELPADQAAVLKTVSGGPTTVVELDERLPWNRKRLYRLVTILERAGLVTRQRIQGKKHGLKEIQITDAGCDAITNGMARQVEEIFPTAAAQAGKDRLGPVHELAGQRIPIVIYDLDDGGGDPSEV